MFVELHLHFCSLEVFYFEFFLQMRRSFVWGWLPLSLIRSMFVSCESSSLCLYTKRIARACFIILSFLFPRIFKAAIWVAKVQAFAFIPKNCPRMFCYSFFFLSMYIQSCNLGLQKVNQAFRKEWTKNHYWGPTFA